MVHAFLLWFCTFLVTVFTVKNLDSKRFFIPPGIFTQNKITAFFIPASLVRECGQKLAESLIELTPVEYYALTTRFLTAVSDKWSFLRQQTPDLPSRSVRGSGQDSACKTIFRSNRASYRNWMSF
jgi:hypothetical protein